MSRGLRIGVALASTALVVTLVVLDLGRTGPGALAATHAQVPALRGNAGCLACHGGGPAEMTAACLQCHAEVGTQLDSGRGLHGGLTAAQRATCGSCHPEHLGAEGALAGARAFRMAGHPGPEGFDHRTVDFELHGRHNALACADCHPYADADPLPEGETRFLGATQACTACHEDPHDGAMQRGCQECHGQEHAFDDLSHFPHIDRFPLHASHSGLACADCHEDGGPHAVTALSDPDVPLPWRTCADCHSSPHAPGFLAALPEPADAPRPPDDQCAACHSARHPGFAGEQVTLTPQQHRATGFPLDDPHAGLACAACHDAGPGASFADRFPGRMADRCAACHDDPHAGQFDREPYREQGCLACHEREVFHPHRFDVARHAQTDFALTGAHAAAGCASCHQLAAGVRRFVGEPQRCEACHADAHDGAFDARLAATGPHVDGACAVCHDTTDFAAASADFRHAPWTGFALEGAHAELDCEACHARSEHPDASGRRFGRVAELHPGDQEGCTACHADPHAGAFADLPAPTARDGRTGCARCHDVGSFHPVARADFDHAWTGFALDGAHAQTACTTCHGRGEERRLGRVADHFAGDPASCATCHPDPHAGTFARDGLPTEVDGRTGCARCHAPGSFRAAAADFDHGRWAGYALVGAHARADCADCHAPLPQADAVGRTSAHAPGRACVACHTDVHAGQFLVDGRSDCARCHDAAAGAFTVPGFDHDADTRFALDATHAKLDCSACHRPARLADGRQVVRYKPLGTECSDCHAVVPEGGR